MATDIQRERLRTDLSTDDDALTDAEIDDAFARASDQYGDNSFAVEAQARILVIQQLIAGAAKRSDYVQNQSVEKRSQVFDHLMLLLELYRVDLQVTLDSAAQWGGLRRTHRRIEEYPYDA